LRPANYESKIAGANINLQLFTVQFMVESLNGSYSVIGLTRSQTDS
jgi:hypothetical protein